MIMQGHIYFTSIRSKLELLKYHLGPSLDASVSTLGLLQELQAQHDLSSIRSSGPYIEPLV